MMLKWSILAVAFAGLFLSSAPASAQVIPWLRAESRAFIVYADASEARVRDLVADLESFDALLRRITHAQSERSPNRLEVYAFRGAGAFQEAFPGGGTTVRGFYSANVDIIASYAIFRDTFGLDAQEILFHEYAHHFLYQYFAHAYPAWYVEGFAEFFQTATFEDNRIVLGRGSTARAEWLFAGSWLPMDRLLTRDLDSSDDVAKFYAQSWLFTHYLFVTPGRLDQLRDYIRALRLGGDVIRSFTEAFHATPEEMQAELRRYFYGNPNALALSRPVADTHEIVTITTMPRSAGELIALSTRLRRGASGEEGAELLERVRDISRSYPDDRFAQITLARAEATLGDVSQARALLGSYIAAYPDDVEALYLAGMTHVREARDFKVRGQTAECDERYAQARRYFVRAHRLDENHVPTLYRYAETFSGATQTASTAENTLNVLLLARRLAPQVQEININAAQALMAFGRVADAVPILRMVAYDPHGGGGAEFARQLLAEAEVEAGASSTPTAP